MADFSVKDNPAEDRLFHRRLLAAFAIVSALTLSLVAKLVYLQVVGHERYATMAKENSVKIVPLLPTRGLIYDRNGKILADNIPSYSLELTPERVGDMEATLARLKALLAIPDDKIEAFRRQSLRQKRFASTPLLMNMSDEELAKFAVARPYFPGVDIRTRLVRYYPYGELASHAVGYVGRISEEELKALPDAEYRGATHVGKLGVEKSYEAHLHGKAGYAEIETNVQARMLRTLSETSPRQGANLYLTLDMDLQRTAYEALAGYNGAVVALEVSTGAVLVFVSRPGFDPNPFVVGIGGQAYQALNTSKDQPLYNRALRGLYPPGSTVKPFVALAGLEHGAVEARQRLYCPGYYQLPGASHKYRDWRRGGHGAVDMDLAITQSCDVYFYRLALALGVDYLHDFLGQFGFGQKTGIDLDGEKAGLLPSRAWKEAHKKRPWFPGETVITGIGQGYWQVTPLQLAAATATLANRGAAVTPFIVGKMVAADARGLAPRPAKAPLPLNPRHVEAVVAAMVNVVHGAHGTAKSVGRGIGYQMAGKTGTAQVFGIKQGARYNEKEIDFKLRDHALFVAFAPAQAPRIAVAVVAENGGHGGSVAAPIAAKVISHYLKAQPGQTHSDHAQLDQTQLDQTQPDQAQPDQAQPDQAQPDQETP